MFKTELIESFPIQESRNSSVEPPLTGITVLDLTHFVAGPFASMMLADYGANVLKVESPGKGDDLRYYPPHDERLEAQGPPYLWSNRNKKSIAIDLKTPAGLALALELVAKADVMMENFSSGVMERLGLDYETCKAINPRLIFVSVSAYGRDGSFKDRGGFDPVVQAESGFISMNGYADREGVRASSSVMDISTALMVCNAILFALMARARTGKGDYVEASLFDTALLMTGFSAMQFACAGKEPRRTGNDAPDTAPSGVFKCQDRSFILNSGNSRIFERLLRQVLDRPDLADDPDMIDRNKRLLQRERIHQILNDTFGAKPWSYWKPRLLAASVPFGEVRTLAEAMTSEEARERKLVTRIKHPKIGWIPNMPLPFKLANTPVVDPVPAPGIGENTVEVLKATLGYDDARIAELTAAGTFGLAAQTAGKL